MQIPKRDIEKSLKKKGFIQEYGDHNCFYHEYKGKRTGAYAKVSYGTKYKDYGIQLIRLLKRQLLLNSIEETKRLLKCPMNAKEYIILLKKKGIIND